MTGREELREAFSKIVIEADRDWNGNVAGYRKYLVDRLTDCGLFNLSASASGSVDREAIARVIDPSAWRDEGYSWAKWRIEQSLKKADSILAHLPAQAVKVKPLEWTSGYPRTWSALTMFAACRIYENDDGAEWFFQGGTSRIQIESLEAAKAAAQADYEQRIRSALVDEVPQVPEANAIDPAAASKQSGSGALSSPTGHIDVSALRRALERLHQCATGELRNIGCLMSSPPQSSAAWNIRNAIEREMAALAATSSREAQQPVALGDIVTVNESYQFHGDWRGSRLRVVGLHIEPSGALWADLIEGEQRHRGNGQYDGETTDFNVDHLTVVERYHVVKKEGV